MLRMKAEGMKERGETGRQILGEDVNWKVVLGWDRVERWRGKDMGRDGGHFPPSSKLENENVNDIKACHFSEI